MLQNLYQTPLKSCLLYTSTKKIDVVAITDALRLYALWSGVRLALLAMPVLAGFLSSFHVEKLATLKDEFLKIDLLTFDAWSSPFACADTVM